MNRLDKLLKAQPGDVVKSGTLNLTLASGLVSAILVLLDAIPAVAKAIVGGGTASPAIRLGIFITIIAAFAVIAVADILARGYASAHARHPVPVREGTQATRVDLDDVDEALDWSVLAVVPSVNGHDEYFVAKDGESACVTDEKLIIKAPAAP